jgi:hypothetical protein
MNSLSLKENGFADFIPLKDLQFTDLPSNQNSVLVLADSTLTGKPTSDIIYIGKSKNPAKRIFGGYLAGYGGKTTRKIHSRLVDDGNIEKVSISWIQDNNPKMAQKNLLQTFKKEHGQYPTWNTQKTSSASPPQKASKIVKAGRIRKSARSAMKKPAA